MMDYNALNNNEYNQIKYESKANIKCTRQNSLDSGGYAGIGLETARVHATIMGRDMIKGKNVLQDLRQSTENEQIRINRTSSGFIRINRSFAGDYIKRDSSLHVLICNAGVGTGTRRLAKDGFESEKSQN
ncbi:unnamed protein product [Rotaria socialis]|uniref:Uncharacterized protein n=1 Tax=Rotaria socialis TaxID=392032 RepID=A0A817ZPG1_9BILA|nr:unnamed protein product [Rotaria socialis]